MLGNLQKKSVVATVIFLLLFISSITYADNTTKDNKVFMVIVNRLSLSDIEYMNNLKLIIENGSIGLMNTRGVIGYKGAEGYMTINASSRAYSSYETTNFYNLDKEIKAIFERRTGKSTIGHSIANIEINKLYNLNSNRTSNSVIGALGDNLHNSGHKTAVFGNSDTADSFIRTNGLIAMDSSGLIDYGNVNDVLIDDNSYPFSIRTDFNRILSEIGKIKSKASFVIIETGDLDRLNQYSTNLTEETFLDQRKKILLNIDFFLENLILEIIDNKSMLLIVSPNSPEGRLDNSRLSPLIIWDGGEKKGVLESGTTRRNGIISNIDIAPTITDYLEAGNNNFAGHVIRSIYTDEKLDSIINLNNRINLVSYLRVPYLNFYSSLIMVIIILGTFFAFIKGCKLNKVFSTINLSLLLITILPIIFLLIARFERLSSITFFFIFLLLMLGLLFIVRFIKAKNRMLFLLTITYFSLVIDLVLGGNLLRYSVLSYDPIIGARFFGIGNEFAGVILTTMIMLAALYMDKTKGHKVFLLILPLTILCVSHPNIGANLGGTISILFASITYLLYIFKVKIDLKKIIFIGIIVLMFVLFMGVIDIYINPNPTHLGRTFLMILNKGPMPIISVILRKALMNVKLMGSSIWSKVLLISILSEICLLLGCRKRIVSIMKNSRFFSGGIISTLIGCIVGLLVNDSGVLLASIANTYLVAIFMYNAFNHRTEI